MKISIGKILKYSMYYTAAATAYNIALNMYADSTAAAEPPLPLLPNPAAALLSGLSGTNAPALLDDATGKYGTWG